MCFKHEHAKLVIHTVNIPFINLYHEVVSVNLHFPCNHHTDAAIPFAPRRAFPSRHFHPFPLSHTCTRTTHTHTNLPIHSPPSLVSED